MRIASTLRRILPHLAAILVIALCVRLALWQTDRADYKQELLGQWVEAQAVELIDLETDDAPPYALVSARGHFDTERHVLLDNQVRNMHSGVHVFTPFIPEGSSQIWMVNRGWQPYDRGSAGKPQFDSPAGSVRISGRLSQPPRVGIQIGTAAALDPEDWPNLMTYFDIDRIRDALGPEVAGQVILLDPGHPAHLSGDDWQPVVFGPERHRAYAFQWWSIGLAVLIIWLVLGVRSLKKP